MQQRNFGIPSLPTLASQIPRTAYSDHGSHDLSGFLIEPLSVPAGVQALELPGQPVVLPTKSVCMEVSSGISLARESPWEAKATVILKTSLPERTCSTETPLGPRPQMLFIATQLFHAMLSLHPI